MFLRPFCGLVRLGFRGAPEWAHRVGGHCEGRYFEHLIGPRAESRVCPLRGVCQCLSGPKIAAEPLEGLMPAPMAFRPRVAMSAQRVVPLEAMGHRRAHSAYRLEPRPPPPPPHHKTQHRLSPPTTKTSTAKARARRHWRRRRRNRPATSLGSSAGRSRPSGGVGGRYAATDWQRNTMRWAWTIRRASHQGSHGNPGAAIGIVPPPPPTP